MYSIGLTGGIGSGKSRVADMLREWGVTIIDTDQISHALTAPDGAALPMLCEAFGPTIIDASGALDRAALRELVFANPAARQRLEAILHPLITTETRHQAQQAAQQQGGGYLVYVVPLLVESGHWRERVNRICVVDCDPVTQIARVQARSRLVPETIQRIMAAQASRPVRLAAADDVIVNDGATTPAQLRARAQALHRWWCTQASVPRTH